VVNLYGGSREGLAATAASCPAGLLHDAADCLPNAVTSGTAVDTPHFSQRLHEQDRRGPPGSTSRSTCPVSMIMGTASTLNCDTADK
jgi:hypothetical protein